MFHFRLASIANIWIDVMTQDIKKNTLNDIREQLDQVDNHLLKLLLQRSKLVDEVKSFKQRNLSNTLRPMRETEQMRYFLSWYQQQNINMPLEGFIATWREIISSSINQQSSLLIFLYEQNYAVARSWFGQSSDYNFESDSKSILQKLQNTPNSIAILSVDDTCWWENLPDGYFVFARLPILETQKNIFCIAKINLKAVGNDISLLYGIKDNMPAEGDDIFQKDNNVLRLVKGFWQDEDIGVKLIGTFGAYESDT